MHSIDIEEYLAAHESRQIKNGKSGAAVWEIEGKYILKYVQKAKLPELGCLRVIKTRHFLINFLHKTALERGCPVCQRYWRCGSPMMIF